jgi:hypothetical protein
MSNIVWSILIIAYFFFSLVAVRSAYFNGVNDGYSYTKDPQNPGYKLAEKYIKERLAGR